MSKKRQCKQYTKECKKEAVALVVEQGHSVPEAAKSLGINPNLLYRWRDNVEENKLEQHFQKMNALGLKDSEKKIKNSAWRKKY